MTVQNLKTVGRTQWYQRLPGGTTRLWDRMPELSALLAVNDKKENIFAFLPVTDANRRLFENLPKDKQVNFSDSRDVDDWLSISNLRNTRESALLYIKDRKYQGYGVNKLIMGPALLEHFGIDLNAAQIVDVEHSVMMRSFQVARLNVSVRVTPAGLKALPEDVKTRLEALMQEGHDILIDADIKPDGLVLSFWKAERGDKIDKSPIATVTQPVDTLITLLGSAEEMSSFVKSQEP